MKHQWVALKREHLYLRENLPLSVIGKRARALNRIDIRKQLNDVLIRNDKIYMNEGIEVRVPFLDQEMIENFLFYSTFKKINFFNQTKPLLRKLFKDQLRGTLKVKKGFISPFNFWITEESNLDKIRFFFSKEYYRSDLIDYDTVSSLLNSKSKNSHQIFSLLMFQIFLKNNNF